MRLNNWPERLAATARNARPFSDSYYCLVFAADCVEAMTGVDHLEDYRGLTQAEATEQFKATGKTLYRHLVSLFGNPIPLALAQRGDVIVTTSPEVMVGICFGRDTGFVSDDGLTWYPTLEQRWAFRVR